jgi:SAM-dependent methyltransferase
MLSTTITTCRCCGSKGLDAILDLGMQPPANSLRRDFAEIVPKIVLAICRCASCGTVQLTECVDPVHLFQTYVWVTGTSQTAQDYSRTFCETIRLLAGANRSLFVVEIASNDGTFLRRFQNAGDRVLGIDPARNLAARASADGIPTWTEFFNRGVARRIRAEEGEADIVFARNVLPHVSEPLEILQSMADCLSAAGLAAIEFHHTSGILQGLQYDSIYHEHLSYFSLGTLEALLERAGMYAFDVHRSPISGGSLVVSCTKTRRPVSQRLTVARDHETRFGTNTLASWQEFARRSVRHRDHLRGVIAELVSQGARLIGYGASARGSTLVNFSGINHTHLLAIADRNPIKQGTWTPGADVRVLAPADALALKPDGVLLLAWNFCDEIMTELRQAGFRGRVVLPLPRDVHIVEM